MHKLLRILLLITFIAVPLANFVLEPILSDGSQFADDPQTRVAAAGYAFAIWAVIFSGMLWFSAAMVFGNEPESTWLSKAMVCLIIAGLASIAFVPISIHCNATIVWIDILMHLVPLALAAIFLRRHVAALPTEPNRLVRWSFFGPSMYFGWICAATVISTSLMANEWGIELGESVATGLAIATFCVLGAVAIWLTMRRDPIYGGTVCWALVAVGVKQAEYPAVQIATWVIAAIVGSVVSKVILTERIRFYPVTNTGGLAESSAELEAVS